MKLFNVKPNVVLKSFEALGYSQVNNNSHIKFTGNGKSFTVPNHKEIKNTTLNRILTENGIDKITFEKIARNGGKIK